MNFIPSVLAAILNTLSLATALAFVAWAALRLLGARVNAATRHVAWWVVLIAVAILPAVPRRRTPNLPSPSAPRVFRSLPAPVTPPYAAPTVAPITVIPARRAWWPLALAALWAAAAAYRIARIMRSYVQLRAWKSRGVIWLRPLPGLRRRARLFESDEAASPIAAGLFDPAVILPRGLRERLSEEELSYVLLHEAAHLARHDDWEKLAAQFARAFLGLHPVAWWALRQIDREREIACDEWVVEQTGAARRYARSLARVVELRMTPAESALAAGIFEQRSRLRNRIELLLETGRVYSSHIGRATVLTSAMIAAAIAAAGAFAPRWIAFAQRPQFEVVSVKLNQNNGPMQPTPVRSGDRISMHNVQPYSVIYYAYHLHGAYQMVNYQRLPEGWNWYDVDTRTPPGATDDQLRLMLQSLLEDRFKLKVHRETREIPEYELTVVNGGPKLTPGTPEPMKVTIEGHTFTQRPGICGESMWLSGLHMTCRDATMATIVDAISNHLHSPIADKTGLTGTYDLHISYLREDGKNPPGQDEAAMPTLEEALPKALGLKLTKSKGPVEVLVIDHMEKPTPN